MTIAVGIYAALFVVVAVWVVIDDLRDAEPVPEVVAEAASFAVLAFGLWLWLQDRSLGQLWPAWCLALTIAIVAQIWACWRDRDRQLAQAEVEGHSPEELLSMRRWADYGTLALFLPAIAVNAALVWRSAMG